MAKMCDGKSHSNHSSKQKWTRLLSYLSGAAPYSSALMGKETAQRIDIEALDKLRRLFECEVADMLEFTDEQS